MDEIKALKEELAFVLAAADEFRALADRRAREGSLLAAAAARDSAASYDRAAVAIAAAFDARITARFAV